METVVSNYIKFKRRNIINYINILAISEKIVSKLPNLDRLLYKYIDQFVLYNKIVDINKMKSMTGLESEENKKKLILFSLLIEYDETSKTELLMPEYYNFYNFIVDSIIIFTKIEFNSLKYSEENLFEERLLTVLSKNEDYCDYYKKILFENIHILYKEYERNCKKESKLFNNFNKNSNYLNVISKIKNSDNLFYSKFYYNNDKLLRENKKDVVLIETEYSFILNCINIDIVCFKVLKNILSGRDKKIFVNLNDNMLITKKNIKILKSMLEFYFLKENIIFIVNTNLMEKYSDRIKYLIDGGFNISFKKNSELKAEQIYQMTKYLFVDYDQLLNDEKEFANKNNLELIIALKKKLSEEEFLNIGDIKYILL